MYDLLLKKKKEPFDKYILTWIAAHPKRWAIRLWARLHTHWAEIKLCSPCRGKPCMKLEDAGTAIKMWNVITSDFELQLNVTFLVREVVRKVLGHLVTGAIVVNKQLTCILISYTGFPSFKATAMGGVYWVFKPILLTSPSSLTYLINLDHAFFRQERP